MTQIRWQVEIQLYVCRRSDVRQNVMEPFHTKAFISIRHRRSKTRNISSTENVSCDHKSKKGRQASSAAELFMIGWNGLPCWINKMSHKFFSFSTSPTFFLALHDLLVFSVLSFSFFFLWFSFFLLLSFSSFSLGIFFLFLLNLKLANFELFCQGRKRQKPDVKIGPILSTLDWRK